MLPLFASRLVRLHAYKKLLKLLQVELLFCMARCMFYHKCYRDSRETGNWNVTSVCFTIGTFIRIQELFKAFTTSWTVVFVWLVRWTHVCHKCYNDTTETDNLNVTSFLPRAVHLKQTRNILNDCNSDCWFTQLLGNLHSNIAHVLLVNILNYCCEQKPTFLHQMKKKKIHYYSCLILFHEGKHIIYHRTFLTECCIEL